MSFRPEGLLHDAERDLIAIAKFLILFHTPTPFFEPFYSKLQ